MLHLSCARAARAGTALLAFTLVTSATAAAQDTTQARDTTRLGTVTVIGSRDDIAESRERLLAIPGGVGVVTPAQLRGSRQANLSDALKFVPGVFVQPRFGAADESQISIRGSGLRNNFHARGINLLVNGMPYRNADGFTDFESLELLTAEAIEVYKGANALRYGGSTLGGAVNLLTHTGYTAAPLNVYAQGGPQGFAKAQLSGGGVRGGVDWYGSVAHTRLDGFRDWSAQQRDRVNLHAGRLFGRASDIRAFYFYARVDEELPGALTRAEFDSDPSLANAGNASNRWGRDYDLHHVGIQLRSQLTPTQRLEISPYLQYREIDHPIFEVISQLSHDWGAEVRYDNAALIGSRVNRLIIGVQPAYQTMLNKQYQNVQGAHGALTRDEHDFATTLAAYLENTLSVTDRVNLIAGFRAERATRKVTDAFLSNGDQSDLRTYDMFTPRVGITTAAGSVRLFANASRTVEPPLLLELSSFGNPGGFIDLRPQSAWQYEIGARSRAGAIDWELSLFDIELRDELLNLNVQPFPGAPFTVPTYRNAPRTRHTGAELGLAGTRRLGAAPGSPSLTGRLSYTLNHFAFVEDPAFEGNALPGAPRHFVAGELRYSNGSGLSITPKIEWVPTAYWITSANDVSNSAWSNVGLSAEWLVARLGTTVFAHAQNLANTRYSASVQVDNAAGRFFEPADPRSLYVGLRWSR